MKTIMTTMCLIISMGCATHTQTNIRPYSQTVGPFASTYEKVSKDAFAAMNSGKADKLIALSENTQAMTAFLLSYYPDDKACADTADRLFTSHLYSLYDSDVMHWKRVMFHGQESERNVALAMMRKRAQSIINGYPFSAERNRFEDIGFACILAEMSEHILPDLVTLVKGALPRWESSRKTTALCVLAHSGDIDAQEALDKLTSNEDKTIVNIYRTISRTK